MNEFDKEIFLLSYAELSVLLTAKGIRDIYLPQNGTFTSDEKELCYLLNDMFQNGLINGMEEKFCVVEPLNTLIMNIGKAEYVLIFRHMSKPDEVIFVYRNSLCNVALRVLEKDNSKIGIFTIENEELIQLLRELPDDEATYMPVLDEEAGYQSILEDKKPVSRGKLIGFHNVSYLLEVMNASSGKIEARLMLRNTENETVIIQKKGKELYSHAWDEDEFKKQIEGLVGGNKYDNG